MSRVRTFALMLALVVATSAIAVSGASAQTASAQLAFVNGASTDAVTVSATGPDQITTDPILFATASEPVVVTPGTYDVAFSDGSVVELDVEPGTAWTVVSQLADPLTAVAFPVVVEPVPQGQAVVVVWNAEAVPVEISVDGDARQVAPDEQHSIVTVDAGTPVEVSVSGVVTDIGTAADNYIDVFAVASADATGVASAVVGSMQALIDALAPPPANAVVPDVEGQSAADATAAILAAGFTSVAQADETSDTIEIGLAIRTDPAAGTELQIDQTITLYVSSGVPTVAVPDVTGLVAGDAASALDDVGLASETVEQSSDDVELGFVISTSPVAGTVVAVDTVVTMAVSTGPEDVTVPSFLGLTSDEAQSLADQLDLALVVEEDADDPDPDGLVVEQTPPVDEVVPAGTEVTVFLAPATEDPWTSIKLDPNRILTAAGINFQAGSTASVSVLDTSLTTTATADTSGYWIATLDTNSLDPTLTFRVVVTGTAEDGTAYEQTFTLPPPGESVDEPEASDGVPTWVWILVVVLIVAAAVLGTVLVMNNRQGSAPTDPEPDVSEPDVGDADVGDADASGDGDRAEG